MVKLKKVLPIIVSLFVLFELSLLFAATDLKIWATIGNPNASFALWTELLGTLVAPFVFVLSGFIFIIYYKSLKKNSDDKSKYNKQIYLGYFFAIVGFGYTLTVFSKIENVFAVFGSVIFVGFLFWGASVFIKKMTPENLFASYCVAVTAVIYCVLVLVVISVIKMFWGRVRPREMESIADFSPWYLPQGINGNRSFPSGHTSNATVLAVITMFAPITQKKWKKVILYLISAAWIIFMAITRVVCGAHFASDTLFAVAISLCLFQISKRVAGKLISIELD